MKKKIIKKPILLIMFLIFVFLFSSTSVLAVERYEPAEPASSDIIIEQTPSGISINDDLLGFSRESANWFKDTIFESVGTVSNVGLWIFIGLLGIIVTVKLIRYFLD